MGDVLDDADVARNEEERDANLALQLAQQVQDLRLHRHIERLSRLVADDQLRLHRQRPGNGDALTLPSRKLVRVALQGVAPQAHLVDQALDGAAACSAAQFRAERADALLEDSWKMICNERRAAQRPRARTGSAL